MANDLYNNWTLEGYNQAYSNTGNNERWPGENEYYQNTDQQGNYRGPDPFGSFRSGIGSFYNQRPVYPGSAYSPHRGFDEFTAQAPERTGIIENLKNKFSRFTTPMMTLLQSQRNTPEENFGLDYYSGSLRDGRVNRNPAFNLHGDMNVASGFGAGLGAAGDKRIARIRETITNLPEQWSQLAKDDPEAYADKLEAHEKKLRQFIIQNKKYKAALAGKGGPEEIKEKITETITPKIIHHQGDGNKGGGGYQDQGGYSTQGGFTGKADPASGGVRGHHGDWADGGRIGYRDGEFVDEDINIQGPGFDVNENIEMAEGPSPFEMRIQELIDEGLSWQEAYTIAANEFGMAEGGDELVSEEGIASLV